MGLSSPSSDSFGGKVLSAVSEHLPITGAILGATGLKPSDSGGSYYNPTPAQVDGEAMPLPDYSQVSAQGAQPRSSGLSTILKLLAGI